MSDRFGRKRLLILAAVLFTITGVLTALAPSFSVFIANRLLGGVAIGLASNLSPMYIAEISPAAMRGRFVSVNQLTIVIGILAAQVVNWLIAEPVPAGATAAEILASWNGQTGWRWMFGAEAVPAFLFFLLMFLVPESPRWLVKNGRPEEAGRVLAKVGGPGFAAEALADIRATLGASEIGRVRFRELLEPGLAKVLLIGVALAVYQQWCGINVIFNYAQEIFTAAGYGVSDVLFNIVVTGAVNLVFTLVAIRLVDRLGRKPLMMAGSAGLAVVFGLIGASYAAAQPRPPHPPARPGRPGPLRPVPRPGDLGPPLRDLPQPHPRRGHVRFDLRPVVGLLRPDLHLPSPQQGARAGRDVLDLRRDQRPRFPLHQVARPRDQGQDPGRDRAGARRPLAARVPS